MAKGIGGVRNMHSLPAHYGYLVALWCGLPALLLITLWTVFQSTVVEQLLISGLPESISSKTADSVSLFTNDIRNIVESGTQESVQDPVKQDAANHLVQLQEISRWSLNLLTLLCLMGCAWVGSRLIKPHTPARIMVETLTRYFLILCASIAIVTTIGIVLSVLFESIRFFQQVSIIEFVTGLKWSPQTAIRVDQVGTLQVCAGEIRIV